MPAQRLPALKAKITGAASKNPGRFKGRSDPKVAAVGDPPSYLTPAARRAWRMFVRRLSWLGAAMAADRSAANAFQNATRPSGFGLKDGGPVPHFAGGGSVTGPGGPRDDRVPAMLSAGEYVVNAASYARYPHLVEAINSGRLSHFANGGAVSPDRIFMRAVPSMASVARPSSRREVMYVQVDKSDLFDVHVQRIAAPMAQAAMIGGSQQALQDLGEARMQTAA